MTTLKMLLTEFNSPKCQCGEEKRPGHVFCRPCYYAIPTAIRMGLWEPIESPKFKAAYEASIKHLHRAPKKEHGKRQPTKPQRRSYQLKNGA